MAELWGDEEDDGAAGVLEEGEIAGELEDVAEALLGEDEERAARKSVAGPEGFAGNVGVDGGQVAGFPAPFVFAEAGGVVAGFEESEGEILVRVGDIRREGDCGLERGDGAGEGSLIAEGDGEGVVGDW